MSINNKSKILLILLILICIPVIMWHLWLITPAKELNIIAIDKTSLTEAGQERASLYWILHYNKYTNQGKLPCLKEDFFGFHPGRNNNYEIHDLSNFSSSEITNLSKESGLLYVIDTYGVYATDWYKNIKTSSQNRLLYGGLNKADLTLINKVCDRKKTIILEFNSLLPPTNDSIRQQICKKFKYHWTGWRGRYFSSLAPSNNALPTVFIEQYEKQHQNNWPYRKAGILLVNDSNEIVVLEQGRSLEQPAPQIVTGKYGQRRYNLPPSLYYPYWFNIMRTGDNNRIVSHFKITPNQTGRELMQTYGLPEKFPAVIQSWNAPYYYYFGGDFTDNPSKNILTAHFKGIDIFKKSFYSSDEIKDRRKFLWEFYYPLMSKILQIESSSID